MTIVNGLFTRQKLYLTICTRHINLSIYEGDFVNSTIIRVYVKFRTQNANRAIGQVNDKGLEGSLTILQYASPLIVISRELEANLKENPVA